MLSNFLLMVNGRFFVLMISSPANILNQYMQNLMGMRYGFFYSKNVGLKHSVHMIKLTQEHQLKALELSLGHQQNTSLLKINNKMKRCMKDWEKYIRSAMLPQQAGQIFWQIWAKNNKRKLALSLIMHTLFWNS